MIYALFQEVQERFEKIEDDTVRTDVVVIYRHDLYSRSAREPDDYALIADGFFSIVLVVAAIGKVLCLANPKYASAGVTKYISRFLKDFSGEETTELPKEVELTAIRNAIAHANAHYYSMVEKKEEKDDADLVLYQRDQHKWGYTEEVYRYTSKNFTTICARMRRLFLSWKKIVDYTKDADEKEAEEEMGR